MAEADSREARRRRRRILQQGSDRLAFIKGQIQALPNPSSDLPTTALPAPELPHGDTDDSNSVLQNPDASETSITPKPPLDEGRSEISSVLPSSEIEHEHEQVQTQPQAFPDSASEEISQRQPRVLEPERFTFINPSDVSSAINASRVTRLCCSIFVALLVVASYIGFSQLINTVISFRPLYFVLLTNLTVVVARLVTGKQTRRRQSSTESSEWDSQLAKTLEIGMVLQSVIDAVFMDCSVYAIVVICGLSLVNP